MLTQEIEKLVKLQELDTEIKTYRETIDSFPARKKQLAQSVESALEDTNLIKKEHKKLQVEKKERELEIQAIEEEIKKLQKRMDEVKTNKEYNSLLSEIETFKGKITGIEDLLLTMMEKDEEINKQLAGHSVKAEEFKKDTALKIQEEEKQIEEMQERLKEKSAGREKLAAEINKALYKIYEKISTGKKDGIAICMLEGESCSRCSVFVPTYIAEKVKTKKEIVNCENCSRILY